MSADQSPYRQLPKRRLLDLFSCAGGAAMGYARAGFDVVGVDVEPQPRYPFEFHQADAIAFLIEHGHGFDVIHASPPCQSYLNLGAVNRALGRVYDHPDLVSVTRALLVASGKPWVIENVEGAPLHGPVRICGTGLHLPLRRHRLFESHVWLEGVPCAHQRYNTPRYWTGWRPNGEHRLSTVVQIYGNAGGREHWPAAMGIDWMTSNEMARSFSTTSNGRRRRDALNRGPHTGDVRAPAALVLALLLRRPGNDAHD